MNLDLVKLRHECLKNSGELLYEAKKAYDSRNWTFSALFAITSYEESLKAALSTALEGKFISEKRFREIWYKHDLKLLSQHAKISYYEDEKTGKITFKYGLPKKEDVGG